MESIKEDFCRIETDEVSSEASERAIKTKPAFGLPSERDSW